MCLPARLRRVGGTLRTWGKVVLSLGFGLAFAQCPLGPVGTSFLLGGSPDTLQLVVGRVTFLLVLMLVASLRVPDMSRTKEAARASVVCCAFGVASFALRLAGPLYGQLAALLLATGLQGVALGAFMRAWLPMLSDVFSAEGRATCVLTFAGSFLLTIPPSILLGLADLSLSNGLLIMLPVVAGACLFVARLLVPTGSLRAGADSDPFRVSGGVGTLLLTQGVTWGLGPSLAVSLGFGSGFGREVSWVAISLCYAALLCLGAAALRHFPSVGTARFGLILRWVVSFTGIGWAFVPVACVAFPRAASVMVVMVFLTQIVMVILLIVESSAESGFELRVVALHYVPLFMGAACAGALLSGPLLQQASAGMGQSAMSTIATVLVFCSVPQLPGRASSASTLSFGEDVESDSESASVEDRAAGVAVACGLTSREREVLACILRGEGREEIADVLSISVWTVKNHVRSIYAKTGSHSVGELLALAYGGAARGHASGVHGDRPYRV